MLRNIYIPRIYLNKARFAYNTLSLMHSEYIEKKLRPDSDKVESLLDTFQETLAYLQLRQPVSAGDTISESYFAPALSGFGLRHQ
jgi:hypothetical protein